MTTRAMFEEIGALQEAVEAIRTRAAHVADIARELESIADAEVADEDVRDSTRRLEELDRLLVGEDAVDDARSGIPGLDQILEHHEQLAEGE